MSIISTQFPIIVYLDLTYAAKRLFFSRRDTYVYCHCQPIKPNPKVDDYSLLPTPIQIVLPKEGSKGAEMIFPSPECALEHHHANKLFAMFSPICLSNKV